MALINLPGGYQWDDTKSIEDQTTDAQSYYYSQIDEANMITDTKDEIGDLPSGKYRWTKRHIDDVSLTPNLQIIQTRAYVHSANHKACGAVKQHGGSIIEI